MALTALPTLDASLIHKMTEELSIAYFRNLLEKNKAELKDYCEDWEKLSNGSDVPEIVSDEIRTTIGLTNLLLQQKLKQFAGLIDDSELKRGEKEITCLDLQGFWDMVYNEVEKIQKRFNNLEKCQQNNWVFVEESIAKKEPKKKPALANTVKMTTDAKARALAARQRLAEAKLKMKEQMLKKSENTVNVQISNTLKDNVPQQKLEVAQKAQEILGSTAESKISGEVRSPLKRTLKNIRNLHMSEQQDDLSVKSEIPAKKLASREITKGHSKKQKSLEKENLVKSNEECIVPKMQKSSGEKPLAVNLQSKRGSKKEVIPLQCVTRSAKRAMMVQQNTLKN
ncbi:Disks large-associated protein 5 [Araneus ventricosus]|uniref:Disks large-associated protein 5 n=1 Tax=Araneus ventricosus TaxID=182803 RepID=A0A4Y2I8R1_ARAVE|nr:Disks large-associated protein 5 [Araneus ventricosus]